jgi:endo-beta-N-acetylglucosaminidase D
MLNDHTHALMAMTQQQIAYSQQRTNNTLARAQAEGIAHDQQNARWEQGEDMQSRQVQGFSNYILDQTVVQDNNMYNNGTIGHGTAWNSTADALVKADPNRFEIVDTPNYWRGIDY